MSDKVHVVLASDANYLPGLEVTRASILRSCKTPERLVWHVFGEHDLAQLDVSAFSVYNTSKMPYFRLFLPELLPELDYVIYSDVDTIWNRDICELWDSAIAQDADRCRSIYWVKDMGIAVAAVRDWFRRTGAEFDASRYGCSGISVMNLRKLRAFGLSGHAIELVRKFGPPLYADQDLLNLMFNDDCGMLPEYWDVMKGIDDWRTPAVYHITGIGRHFHDKAPPVYPPQYQLWWNVRTGARNVHGRSRLLAALWPLHGLAKLLPLALRERIVRQWFFAKVLVENFA